MSKNKIDFLAFEQIKEYLLEQPMARISPSGKELSMRCPFCGDSVKSSTSTNFSINIDPESNRFLNYQCFRSSCLTKGVVDQDFLDRLGFVKYDCIRELNNFLRVRNKQSGNKKYRGRIRKELSNVLNTSSKISNKKLEYINNRLGLDLSFKDLYDLKINLSLSDLLRINEVSIPKGKEFYYDALSNYGVSFISAYNDYVIIRDISKSGKLHKRYTNINIFDNYDNVTKAYCIPTKLNLLSTEPTVINITEGAFDILGVYYHLDIDRNYENQLFLAASGAGIVNVIYHYIKQYGLINIKINIFSDSDVSVDKYKKLKKIKELLFNFDVTIYYNTIKKDFGVKKDEINLIHSRL